MTALPPTQHLDRPDGRLAFDDTGGDGPLIVCVPGLGVLRSEHRFLRPLLVDAGWRVVTMDLRGHGESSVEWPSYAPEAVGDDIVALLAHLDGGPAVVLGESMAAASAVWAAAEAPEAVRAIVLTGPFARQQPPRFVVDKVMPRLITPRLWRMYLAKLFPGTPPADLDAHLDAVRANLAEPGRGRALRRMLAAPKTACEARMPEVAVPALVVMGTADPDFDDPAAEAAAVAAGVRGEVLLVDGAGHYPHVEQPERVAAAITDLVAGGGR